MLDWREKHQAKAAVMQTIKVSFRPLQLPVAYSREIRTEKLARAYAHVYHHYFRGPSARATRPSAKLTCSVR